MKPVSTEAAAEVLRGGKVALIPTETVVGLIAGDTGLHRIWEIKGRDPDKPVALLCASAEEAFALTGEVPLLARKLAALYWPGPLTLVLASADGGTVGLRVPDHPAVRDLLTAYGGPLYATSANLSGKTAPRAIEDVDERVMAGADFALAGDPGGGEASAVVDLSGGGARLLRATAELTEERLALLAEETKTNTD